MDTIEFSMVQPLPAAKRSCDGQVVDLPRLGFLLSPRPFNDGSIGNFNEMLFLELSQLGERSQ